MFHNGSMAQDITITGIDEPITTYKVGRFAYTVEGSAVLVTRDDGGSIVTLDIHHYKAGNEAAHDAAWRMAKLQSKA